MPLALRTGQTIVFTGDSITAGGRPLDRPEAGALGSGFVRVVADLLAVSQPRLKLRIINSGVGGNNVRDLMNRWTDDVIAHSPDWVSITVGINDAYQWANQLPIHVRPTTFQRLYDQILARLQEKTRARVVLVEPFYISRDVWEPTERARVLRTLPDYQRTVRRLARKYNARLVRAHAMYQRQLHRVAADYFCPDPVHPNATGTLWLAYEWLRTMGWLR
jgi:lysophospholipase L1-like esterase